MATKAWFNYSKYMENKLVQMQETYPDENWTSAKLNAAFEKAGFVGDAGAQAHFQKYGHTEDVSPNAYFDAEYYYKAKAIQYYTGDEGGNMSREDVLAKIDEYATNMKGAIKAAGMDAWTHYVKYGTAEGVNPSNSFDTSDYMAAKVEAMAGSMTEAEVYDAFKKAGFNALSHFMQYAGKGDNEVASSDISDYAVPESEQIDDGGSDATSYTLLREDAVLTDKTSSNVSPEGHLTSSNEEIDASTKLDGAVIQDPSESDADVLTASINNAPTATIKNIETIKFDMLGGAVDVSGITGTKRYELTATKDSELDNIDTTVSDGPTFALVGGSKAITLAAEALDGDADALNVEVNGFAGTLNLTSTDNDTLEAFNIVSDGDAANELTLALVDGADNDGETPVVKSTAVTGKADLKLTVDQAMIHGQEFDASSADGKVDLFIDRVDAAAATNVANVTGVNSMAVFTSGAEGAAGASLNNIATGSTIVVASSFANASEFIVKGSGSKTDDSLTIALDNIKDSTNTEVGSAGADFANSKVLTVADVETINIESAGAKSGNSLVLDAAAAKAVTIDGESSLNLTLTDNAGSTSLANITVKGEADHTISFLEHGTTLASGNFTFDAGEAKGDVTADLSLVDVAAKASMIANGGAGDDEFTVGITTADTKWVVDAGAGDDIITLTDGAAGAFQITTGEGSDTVVRDATATTSTLNITDFTLGSGSDVLSISNSGIAALSKTIVKGTGTVAAGEGVALTANQISVYMGTDLTSAANTATAAELATIATGSATAGDKSILVAYNNKVAAAQVYLVTETSSDSDVTTDTVVLLGTFDNATTASMLDSIDASNFAV